MELPIYIDGKKEGVLTVERQGAATVMRAELRDVGRVVRLTIYGEKAGYLGVPEPDGGKLRLARRFSPAEMRRFPERPEYVAERPLTAQPSTEAAQSARNAPERQVGGGKQGGAEEQGGQVRHVLWMGGKPHYF